MNSNDGGAASNDDQLSYAQHEQRPPLWRRLQQFLVGPQPAKANNNSDS